MAKRKTSGGEAVVDTDVEDLAYFLTVLIWSVDPTIHQATTYDVLSEMLALLMDDATVSEQDAVEFGAKIRATRKTGDKPHQLH